MSANVIHSGCDENGSVLFCLGPTTFLFSLGTFLSSSDILALRATCKKSYNFFHNENESNEFWKLLLRRDCGFEKDDDSESESDSRWWNKTLGIAPLSSSSTSSLFGIDPWRDPEGLIVPTSNPFESWKRWKKCSSRFYLVMPSEDLDVPIPTERERNSVKRYFIRAPFFLRAALFWQKLSRWCRNLGSLGSFGNQLLRTFAGAEHPRRGLGHFDWGPLSRDSRGLDACYAIFAFSRGQTDILTAALGFIGGYEAYDYKSSIIFQYYGTFPSPGQSPAMVVVGVELLNHPQHKNFRVDSVTGSLHCYWCHSLTVEEKTCAINLPTPRSRQDDLLLWLEEHMRRLDSGQCRVQSLTLNARPVPAITLYPQFRRDSSPIVTEGVSLVSRVVTRGIEVVASAVHVPQAGHHVGFIYSIRIRLLTPADGPEYVSPSERGFETCQLWSRHWRITNDSTGRTEMVHGEGVIGMYPLLWEGGFTLDNQEPCHGVFQYQSCTGQMNRGSFSGHLRFVPGSLHSPTGHSFDVALNPFELNDQPEFFY